MKKNLLIYAAITLSALMFTTGCAKKNKTEELPEENPVTVEEVTEPPFMEYSSDDFRKIEIPVQIADDPAPVELHCIDLTELDFGSRLSPCKGAAVRDRFGSKMTTDDPEVQAQIDEENKRRYENAFEGGVYTYAMDGDYVYMIVDFDDYCGNTSHDFSVFSYRISTGELKELRKYSSIEQNYTGFQFFTANGNLYMSIYLQDGKGGTALYQVDKQSGEISEIGTFEYIQFIPSDDRLMAVQNSHGENGSVNGYIYSEYDFETNKLNEIQRYTDEDGNTTMGIFCGVSGDMTAYNTLSENNRISVNTDLYRLDTNFSIADIKGFDENSITLEVVSRFSGYDKRTLHRYIFDKMEHQVLDTSKLGSTNAVNGNNIIFSHNNIYFGIFNTYIDTEVYPMYLLNPNLGMAFRLMESGNYANLQSVGNMITFMELEKYEHIDHLTDNMHSYKPSKIYWIEN